MPRISAADACAARRRQIRRRRGLRLHLPKNAALSRRQSRLIRIGRTGAEWYRYCKFQNLYKQAHGVLLNRHV